MLPLAQTGLTAPAVASRGLSEGLGLMVQRQFCPGYCGIQELGTRQSVPDAGKFFIRFAVCPARLSKCVDGLKCLPRSWGQVVRELKVLSHLPVLQRRGVYGRLPWRQLFKELLLEPACCFRCCAVSEGSKEQIHCECDSGLDG